MRGGPLRFRVEVQRRTDTRDAHGQPIPTWDCLFKANASIRSLRGTEFFQAQQVQSGTDVEIRLRNMGETPTPKDRVKHAKADGTADYYDISAVLPDVTMRREFVLMCRKRDQEGWRG